MPWFWVILGLGSIYLLLKKPNPLDVVQNASWFYQGQIINVPANTEMYSDAALTQDAGAWPGGTATVKVVDVTNNSIGFVGPSGQGLGGGAPAYIRASAAQFLGKA